MAAPDPVGDMITAYGGPSQHSGPGTQLPHRCFLPLPAAVLTFPASRTSQPALIALQNRFRRQTLLPLGSRGLRACTGMAGLSSPSSSSGWMPGTDWDRSEQRG